MSVQWALTLDCADPARLAAFWKLALGYADAAPPAGFDSWEAWFVACEVPEDEWGDGAVIVDPDGSGARMSLLKVPEGKTAKNRLHLDLQVSGGRAVDAGQRTERITATVERLVGAGASVLGEHEIDGKLDHVVLRDPEGNEFCVV